MYVRVPFVICDEKDLASCVTGMYASSNCRRPCNICLVDFTEGLITHLGDPRTLADMNKVRMHVIQYWCVQFTSQLLSDKPTIVKLKEWSIHPEPNALFLVPGLDVFRG